MITFNEFCLKFSYILEKYYAPDEKLPSGETPVQKAKKRGIKGNLLHKVERGADNKEVDITPKNGLKVTKSFDTVTIHHPESKIEFDITKKRDNISGKPHHEINWWNDGSRHKTPKERKKAALTAKKMWDDDVQHRLPYGSVVSNEPASKKHAKIYKRAGMGEPHEGLTRKDYGRDDRYNRQYATVGRVPSSKQKAKGKRSRLSPMDPPKEKQGL